MSQDGKGFTPLDVARYYGNTAVAQLLALRGAIANKTVPGLLVGDDVGHDGWGAAGEEWSETWCRKKCVLVSLNYAADVGGVGEVSGDVDDGRGKRWAADVEAGACVLAWLTTTTGVRVRAWLTTTSLNPLTALNPRSSETVHSNPLTRRPDVDSYPSGFLGASSAAKEYSKGHGKTRRSSKRTSSSASKGARDYHDDAATAEEADRTRSKEHKHSLTESASAGPCCPHPPRTRLPCPKPRPATLTRAPPLLTPNT